MERRRALLAVVAELAVAALPVWVSCATHTPPRVDATAPRPDLADVYLPRLIEGNPDALLALFAGEPAVDDPLGGRVRGVEPFRRFAAERSAWLRERNARLTPMRTTHAPYRSVSEAVLNLVDRGRAIALPIAVVAERAADERAAAFRVYHSRWPLDGKHTVRPPLLPRDPAVHPRDIVAAYQRALAAGDVDAVVATFEPDGYFREPSGGIYVHRGAAALRAFMSQILAAGGIGLEHATVTDDGVVTAIEFNAVSFGPRRLTPQAGLAIYERGPTGKLAAARIYDDVNVEELAPAPGAAR